MNKTYKAFVVEDEEKGCKAMKTLIERYCHALVWVGEARSVADAVAIIPATRPDLVFLDIMLPDGNAFDLLSRFTDRDFEVIFVTAFEDHSLRAFRVAALDYLLKPVSLANLKDAVARFVSVREKPYRRETDPRIEVAKQSLLLGKQENIIITSAEGFSIIPLDEVIRCEADGNYTRVILAGGRQMLSSKSLSYFEDVLQDTSFVRVHHKHLINLMHLEKYHRGRGGYVVMKDGSEVDVSVRRREEFLSKVERFSKGLGL